MFLNINNYVLIILVILAMYFDITSKKIPNKITFPAILFGLIGHSVFNGLSGLAFASIGFVVGFGIYLIPFLMGGMGAGDVKLLAAIGAMMGWEFVLYTAITAGLVGGVIVIIYLIYRCQLLTTLKRMLSIVLKPILSILNINFNNKVLDKMNNFAYSQKKSDEKYYIPYGVAIGIGAIIVFII